MTGQPAGNSPSDPDAWVYGWGKVAGDPSYPFAEPPETPAEAEARLAEDAAANAEGEAAYYAYTARVARAEGYPREAVKQFGRDAEQAAEGARDAWEAAGGAAEVRAAEWQDREAGS